MDRTDEQLALASRWGDSQAFGTLVQRLRAPLIGHITGLLGTRDDAEELAQETFLVAWQRIRSLRQPARVAGWICRIGHNLAMKRAKTLHPVPLTDEPPAKSGENGKDERLVSLLAAVARLSQPHRDVISRKHFAGQTGDQIARELGIPPGTVRSRLSRAYTELREMLSQRQSD